MLAMLFVIFVTPYEVAHLETELNVMFLLNRVVDVIFLIDMALQFFVMFQKKTKFGQTLETNHKRIMRHYVRGWFPLDFVSILPFDSFALGLKHDGLSRAKAVKL